MLTEVTDVVDGGAGVCEPHGIAALRHFDAVCCRLFVVHGCGPVLHHQLPEINGP